MRKDKRDRKTHEQHAKTAGHVAALLEVALSLANTLPPKLYAEQLAPLNDAAALWEDAWLEAQEAVA